MPSSLNFIAFAALLSPGAASGDWPVKTFDPSDRGANCECMGRVRVIDIIKQWACVQFRL